MSLFLAIYFCTSKTLKRSTRKKNRNFSNIGIPYIVLMIVISSNVFEGDQAEIIRSLKVSKMNTKVLFKLCSPKLVIYIKREGPKKDS